MAEQKRFAGKVAIVTGGAGGIGQAIARRLTAEGAKVAIFDHNEAGARSAADAIEGAAAFTVDVTDDAQVSRAVQDVIVRWGGVDILVNNAGGNPVHPAPFWEFTAADLQRMTALNYFSQWYCTKAVLAGMDERPGAAIVNIASGAGANAVVGLAAYGSAKAAVMLFTEACAKELAPRGIRVNAIAPGYVQSEKRSAKVFSEAESKAIRDRALAGQLLDRMGLSDDVASVVAFLCSEDARHMTGQVLKVNGGSR